MDDEMAGTSDSENILDWLIRDCLHAVFDRLSTEDILNTMTVSRRWQEEILEYLRVARFCFEFYYMARGHYIPRLLGLIDAEETCRRRTTPVSMTSDARTFKTNIVTLGPCIVSIVLDCLNESSLKAITENCPKLEDLMLVGIQGAHTAHEPPTPFLEPWLETQCEVLTFSAELLERLRSLRLKRVAFVHCPIITEESISQFLKNDALKELIICRNRFVDGQCLSDLKATELKSLRLIGCTLATRHLTAVVNRLSKLTMLDLSNNPVEILQNVHLILDKTPNLENLVLNTYQRTNVGNEFVAALRRLSCLKHLSLCWNDNLCDEWLEAVGDGCQDLLTLDIEARQMHGVRENPAPPAVLTARGLVALCRGARGLRHICVAGQRSLTAELAACVSSCRHLQWMDVRGCRVPREAMAAASEAARGRARRLKLSVARTAVGKYELAPAGLLYDFVDTPRTFRLV